MLRRLHRYARAGARAAHGRHHAFFLPSAAGIGRRNAASSTGCLFPQRDVGRMNYFLAGSERSLLRKRGQRRVNAPTNILRIEKINRQLERGRIIR